MPPIPAEFSCVCGTVFEIGESGEAPGSVSRAGGAPISVRVTAAHKEGEKIFVTWSDGSTDEYLDLNQMIEQIGQVETIDQLKRIWMGCWLAHSPDASDPSAILNKTITMELGDEQPFQITG